MLNTRQLLEIIEKVGIADWGAGYFSINEKGDIICTPKGNHTVGISLPDVIEKAKQQGLSTPMIIRFPELIKNQLERMHSAFSNALQEFNYSGNYHGVFPFKVNQRREFIDSIVECGKDLGWGLEVGSKTEFMAALSYTMREDALLICNGFKDKEFIEMAFLACHMGRKVHLVVEGPDELEMILDKIKTEKRDRSKCPSIGLRVKLYSKGSGKWQDSSGSNSKFGLTTIEVMNALALLDAFDLKTQLSMLHFHIGSQITAIKRFKEALKEAARVYAKIIKMGYTPSYLNIGGGVGVDYDGSQTSSESSANYSLQEFANDAVYVISEVCKNEAVTEPNIVSESGRVIAAYHSVVVTDIREVQGEEKLANIKDFEISSQSKESGQHLKELFYVLKNMTPKNFVEFYHDAVEHHEDLYTLFNLGYLSLEERAVSEEVYKEICLKALHYSYQEKYQSEEFAALKKIYESKYLANFSIFQSIPDSWSIGQLFPVLPLSRHDERTSHQATIVDITCDSDGCLKNFIDKKSSKTVIDLHSPNDKPYYLGFFLVGAYQESLANEHNLFGAIHEVEVHSDKKDGWVVSKVTEGDPIKELLTCRNYEEHELLDGYRQQLEKSSLSDLEQKTTLIQLEKYLSCYPYLKE